MPGLAIGGYSFSVQKQGFHSYTQAGIVLGTAQTLELNATLEVGAVSETIQVTPRESLVETSTSEVGQTVIAQSIESLPLGNRRTMNVVQISGLATFLGDDGIPTYSLAGGRLQSQMVWIDGGTGQNIRIGVGQQNVDPPVEAVQEIRIIVNSCPAEFGGSAGGVAIETTKSGGNQVHGSAYEYFRNDALDAPGYFATVVNGEKQRPERRYNVFGATAGGPIRRNRTFFFASYEGNRRLDALVTTLTVPTAAERSGDFSKSVNAAGVLIPVYDPDSSPRHVLPGNMIPADRVDPVGMRVAGYFPLPNRKGDNLAGANNFRQNGVTAVASEFLLAKLDHNWNDRNRLTGRYILFQQKTDPSSVFPDPGADNVTHNRGRSQYGYGSWTRIVSPAMINELRYTYVRRSSLMLSTGVGGNYPEKIGLKGVDPLAFPQFVFDGYGSLGSPTQERRQSPIEQRQVVENFTWVRHRHDLKAGWEVRSSRNQEVFLQSVSGALQFSSRSTGLPGTASGASGNALASLLLGLPLSIAASQTPALDRRSWYLAGFLKDDWSVTRALTVNLGLRWEMDTPMVDANGNMNGFDTRAINPVSGTPGVVKFAGVGGFPQHPYRFDWNNFGPRFGFAWKPGGSMKMAIRAGYGIYFAHPLDSVQATAASLGVSLSALQTSPDNGLTAPFRLRDGVQSLTLIPAPRDDTFGAVPVGRNPTTAVSFFERNRVSGYAHQFNLTAQRQLPGSVIVEVSGLGNLGRKLPSANLNINQIPPQILGPNHMTQADRPFPQFNNVMLLAPSLGISNYYAGTVKVEKRMSHGLNLLASYTQSKFLGNTNDSANPSAGSLGQNNGPYSNYYNRRADYGPLESDVERRLAISLVYELPGRSRLVRGWTIGALSSAQSGVPMTVVDSTGTDTTNAFPAGKQRANVARDPNLPASDRSLTRWFDTSAFSQPALFTFGNEGLGIVRSGRWVSTDLSLLRSFVFREWIRLQVRGEFFNAFNHTIFVPPGVIFGTQQFGVVPGAAPARQVQVGARLVF